MKHQSQGKKSSSAKKAAIGTGFITEVDRYLFGQGTHYQIYDKLGAHPKTYRGILPYGRPTPKPSAWWEISTAGIPPRHP